jgi:Fructose-2,6-bisphosphatase
LKHIYLIRHCKAAGQEPGAQLTAEGHAEAELLANFLIEKQIDYIVSSPYDRAISTIQPLAQKHKLKINVDDRLRERVLSAYELDNWMERLKETYQDLDIALPGGESSREAMNRGVSAIEELLVRTERNLVVVTHGNLMSLILKYYDDQYGFDEWRGLTNPDVYEIVVDNDGVKPNINRIWK